MIVRILLLCLLLMPHRIGATPLVETIEKIKPSIVAIILVSKNPQLPALLVGTGFVVADGQHVITNYHVIRERLNSGGGQILFALTANGPVTERRTLDLVAGAPEVDLALMKLGGRPLPALRIREEVDLAPEGTEVAMTGFPVGGVLGFHPATSRGIVSALTANRSPELSSAGLDPAVVRAPRYQTYQLDIIAFPGNSGGPLYKTDTGEVLGVVASTFIKTTKEKLLSDPSAISYAIPSGFIRQLLMMNKLTP